MGAPHTSSIGRSSRLNRITVTRGQKFGPGLAGVVFVQHGAFQERRSDPGRAKNPLGTPAVARAARGRHQGLGPGDLAQDHGGARLPRRQVGRRDDGRAARLALGHQRLAQVVRPCGGRWATDGQTARCTVPPDDPPADGAEHGGRGRSAGRRFPDGRVDRPDAPGLDRVPVPRDVPRAACPAPAA